MTGDKILECQECHQEFAFTVDEQGFYRDKGLEEPKYCMICRGVRVARERDLARFGGRKGGSRQ